MFKKFRSLFSLRAGTPEDEQRIVESFKDKYNNFRDLLESNSELLQIIAELQDALTGETIFGTAFLRSQAARATFHGSRIVASLNGMSGGRYHALETTAARLHAQIRDVVSPEHPAGDIPYVMPYSSIDKNSVDWVGGKNANLGEMSTVLELAVPRGFAITTAAYRDILAHNDILDAIQSISQEIIPDDTKSMIQGSEDIQRLILSASIPPDVAAEIEHAWEVHFEAAGVSGVAVRSSAVGEDSELSYAGQYLSILNVTRERLLTSYLMVLASLFTPRAISYRLYKGVPLEETAMSVACLEMVDSLASGVMYSRHPYNPADDNVLINAVWGLGPYAVDGVVSPDTYRVGKATAQLLSREVSHKVVQLISKPEGGVEERPVPLELVDAPCLDESRIMQLAEFSTLLETHYGCPQDTEWAFDRKGRVVLLQTRPLGIDLTPPKGIARAEPVPGYQVLLEGGEAACPGVGCGPVRHVEREEDIADFPSGAVLVARHSSPKYVVIMRNSAAVVTDSGSVTGHMASLAREFKVPALLNTHDATSKLQDGEIVTVDAWSRRIYAGKVVELLKGSSSRQSIMKGTPVHEKLQRLAALIVPLTLTDPKSKYFTPENCKTLHDVMRYAHERSYAEMFSINDVTSHQSSLTVRLDAPVPFDLYLIDLGDGVAPEYAGHRNVPLDSIRSVPFRALLQGMMHEGLQSREPRPIHLKGFLSVLSQQVLSPPNLANERFGDRSYALISEKYVNFSSRVGYHYGIIDAYCGLTVNKNYVNFEFKGGAADEMRRNRRARAIARILGNLGFDVEATGDRVVARYQKYEQEETEERLDALGRLLIFTRQMDMLMNSEQSVEHAVECFLAGRYDLSDARS
ncbi:phosphoenolpyruvate synthase [Oceanidesulfovibrio indonesiensis]|uniref:Phosphoenolpyruvate synthase n=1 Tax=Oceanidesulfovibrio indonesiensis TaxID=54767 RepID=A0A7M3MAE8_9BACT|nr:PEP/pyruvate-binding domain-containing protein [Oceanidesulfovibrio indonesiensis]TVM14612.1 phosphoenolpyruvate synthase [Oceanidesulfovibrio indonesiensis]